MSHKRGVRNEFVSYRRSAALPGIEVVEARDSPREWRVFCQTYAVVVYSTWRGIVYSRGRVHRAEPGLAFCNTPGEAMTGTPAGPGSFDVIEFEADVLDGWLSEQRIRSTRPAWSSIMKPLSSHLTRKFRRLFDGFLSASSAMKLQSQAIELSDAMIREMMTGVPEWRGLEGPPLRGTARMRECLNEEGLDIDLDTLARRAGLSRFQALRSFKLRYGLPPHAYQLCLRVSEARRLLIQGHAAADVAQRCGFADQSHFTRHFKRVVGTTPMQYARARASAKPRARSLLERRLLHETAVVSRSDHF